MKIVMTTLFCIVFVFRGFSKGENLENAREVIKSTVDMVEKGPQLVEIEQRAVINKRQNKRKFKLRQLMFEIQKELYKNKQLRMKKRMKKHVKKRG